MVGAGRRLQHGDDLSVWHVRTVILGPVGNRTAMRLFFTRLLDHPPVWSGAVDVWWHADNMVNDLQKEMDDT
jgi:hypothetical protein